MGRISRQLLISQDLAPICQLLGLLLGLSLGSLAGVDSAEVEGSLVVERRTALPLLVLAAVVRFSAARGWRWGRQRAEGWAWAPQSLAPDERAQRRHPFWRVDSVLPETQSAAHRAQRTSVEAADAAHAQRSVGSTCSPARWRIGISSNPQKVCAYA